MELHEHGKIWAESEGEGKGCTFFVQLPLHSHHYVAPAADAMVDVSLAPSIEHHPSRVDSDEKQSELDDHFVSTPSLVSKLDDRPFHSLPPAPAQPSGAVVEATWKPTILVVDDSAMNRKVAKSNVISTSLPPFLHRSLFSQ